MPAPPLSSTHHPADGRAHLALALAGSEVRRKGGFNGLWGATLKEVNDRMAQFGGRLSLDEPDAEAGAAHRWKGNCSRHHRWRRCVWV